MVGAQQHVADPLLRHRHVAQPLGRFAELGHDVLARGERLLEELARLVRLVGAQQHVAEYDFGCRHALQPLSAITRLRESRAAGLDQTTSECFAQHATIKREPHVYDGNLII